LCNKSYGKYGWKVPASPVNTFSSIWQDEDHKNLAVKDMQKWSIVFAAAAFFLIKVTRM
jgi:hypothetical protein